MKPLIDYFYDSSNPYKALLLELPKGRCMISDYTSSIEFNFSFVGVLDFQENNLLGDKVSAQHSLLEKISNRYNAKTEQVLKKYEKELETYHGIDESFLYGAFNMLLKEKLILRIEKSKEIATSYHALAQSLTEAKERYSLEETSLEHYTKIHSFHTDVDVYASSCRSFVSQFLVAAKSFEELINKFS